MSFLGDKLFGQDVDHLFAYQTVRVVKIYDRTLGLVKNTLTLVIFVYIFIFNIWYKGSHFAFSPVEGITRLQWQEPTKKCNPLHVECEANYNGITELPYCLQYKGTKPAPLQKNCDYFDARELPLNIGDGVLLPTYIAKYKQVRGCPVGAPSCDVKWKYANPDGSLQSGTGYAKVHDTQFVADVEDYTMLIDHTFRTGRGNIQKDDFQMQGNWKMCNQDHSECTEKPIKCVHNKCEEMHMNTLGAASFLNMAGGRSNSTSLRASKQRRSLQETQLAPEADDESDDEQDLETATNMLAVSKLQKGGQPQVIAIKDGDVLSLETLLAMAGESLDSAIKYVKADGGTRTRRYRGLALVVSIEYRNLVRWTLLRPNEPWYTISVTAMPADTFKHADVVPVDADHRDVQLSYGVMVVVKQTGNLAFFDPMFALISFASALALLAVASTLTEFLMLSVLPRKDRYQELKYLESEDFHADEEAEQKKESTAA